MALANINRFYPCPTRGGLPDSNKLKKPLLPQPCMDATARPALKTASPLPNTMKMSLDEWVAYETQTCSHSRAAEAARRIRAAQRSKNQILDLYRCHLHSVPPLVGLEHVTYYKLATNCLMQIPDDLGELPNLKSLCVSSNGLRTIPLCSKYNKLSSLEVGGNPVRHVPSELRDRALAVYVNQTLVYKYHRKQARAAQRRTKVRTFLQRRLPWLPEWFLPNLNESMPTFDGGDACDLNLRPFPHRTGHEKN